jgi:BioD-like phosphotransacetylase family protein
VLYSFFIIDNEGLMKTIFISATLRDSGQSLLTWLLAEELVAKGLTVGLFRPMGTPGPGNEDPLVHLMFDAMGDHLVGGRKCPVLVDPKGGVAPELVEFYLDNIKERFDKLKGSCDVCLAVGSRDVFFDTEQSALPDTRFIEMFDARVLLIDRFLQKSSTVYSSLALASFLRDRLAGIFISRVPEDEYDEFANITTPFLKEKGVPILGVFAEDSILSAPTVQNISDVLMAKMICCGENKMVLATGRTIGTQSLGKDMRIFKRVINKILLTGGTPEQIEKGDTENVCGVVLTGGREPAQAVLDAAKGRGLPVLLTQHDTFVAMEKIVQEKIYTKPSDRFRMERLRAIIAKQTPLDKVLEACGI